MVPWGQVSESLPTAPRSPRAPRPAPQGREPHRGERTSGAGSRTRGGGAPRPWLQTDPPPLHPLPHDCLAWEKPPPSPERGGDRATRFPPAPQSFRGGESGSALG